MSYSQFGQDLWVLNYFPTGIFIDVGFNDGIVISNTKLLEEKGWKGLGIDPFPKNIESRTNTIIELACVYKEPTKVNFTCASDLGGIADHIDAHKGHPWMLTAHTIPMQANTLEYFLVKHQMPFKIEYLSIDTEGSEYEILSSFPFDKYTFGCITCEHNHETDKRNNILKLLDQKGYIFQQELGVDDCFVHSSVVDGSFINKDK
jgi:hypothetical protein